MHHIYICIATVEGHSFNPLQLASHDVTERKWACTSLSHLLGDTTQRTRLIEGRVVRRLAPLLLDEVMEIREAAAGALRWSLYIYICVRGMWSVVDLYTPLRPITTCELMTCFRV